MKRSFISLLAILSTSLFLIGCAVTPSFSLGGGTKTVEQKPTVGQQLVDLKKAKDCGAISDSEYQAQKTKLLAGD